jgi:L-iditol 2-dehydrogenase
MKKVFMRALKITGKNQIGIYEVDMPEVGPNDVLTKVKYCGICGTDVAIYSGETNLVKSGLIKYPVRPGHEWSGIVEAVGREVKDIKPGDRVVGDTAVSCGFCKACLSGNYMLCGNLRCVGTINSWDGGFADYTLFPARHVYKIPDNIGLDEAAMIEPAALGMNALQKSGFKPGQTVLVIGTGAIGLLSATLANACGASKVILAGLDRKSLKCLLEVLE